MDRRMYILLIVITVIFIDCQNGVCFYPCNCQDNRVLKLSTPLMEGEDIKILQQELKKIGLYQGAIDGIYGIKSARAVIAFQELNKLKKDGIAGKEFWLTLGQIQEPEILKPITRGIKPDSNISITINLYNRTLTIIVDGQPYKNYPVTIGKPDSVSPVGEWIIKNKYIRIDDGPLGSRWIGLNVPWGVYGIHGTNKPWEIGRNTSLGCIRMHNKHIEEIYDWVEHNTEVKITGPWPEITIFSPIKPGQSGLEVQKLQRQLRKAGFYHGFLDGNYGTMTERAINEIEALFNLKVDGITDNNILCILDRLKENSHMD